MRRARSVLLLAALAVTAALAGCRDTPDVERLAWRSVEAPAGARLTTLGSGTPVLASGTTAAGAPALWQVEGWTPVPLTPASYYGGRAELVRVAAADPHVVALGRAVGGAHGNPRWTTWTGTTSGVRETVQPFETFGGPSAIGVTDVASGPGGDVVVGSWAAGGRPAGIAVWTPRGADWLRADTVLGLRSSTTDLNAPSAVAVRGQRFVVAGSTTHLGGGRVAVRATAFVQRADGSWRASRLPGGGESSAADVACSGPVCLLAGVRDDRLAVWRLGGEVPGSVRVPVSTPVAGGPGSVLVATDGDTGWVLASGPQGRVTAWRVRGADVRPVTAPPGKPTALAAGDGTLFVLTDQGLWRARP